MEQPADGVRAVVGDVRTYLLLFWRGSTVSDGADRLMQNKKRWVATYELASVKIADYDGPHLTLEDRSGRWFASDLEELQEKPWIWDYAYNGILHSVVEGGAGADPETRSRLRLPPAPDDGPDPP